MGRHAQQLTQDAHSAHSVECGGCVWQTVWQVHAPKGRQHLECRMGRRGMRCASLCLVCF